MSYKLFSHSLTKHPNVFVLLLLTGTLLFTACSKDKDDEEDRSELNVNSNDNRTQPELSRLEFPRVKGGNSVVLVHTTSDSYGVNYSVEWDKEKKSQRWSCYQLNRANSVSNTQRYKDKDNQYPMDPLLPSADYMSRDLIYGSGYEHGHICPSADRLYSYNANLQTFYLTNMQPQDRIMNSGMNYDSPWYRLEMQVRAWATASTTENLYIVKGGTIEDHQLREIVKNELRVPKYFFVALLLKNAQGYKACGFWMEHDGKDHGKEPLGNFAVNIRELERRTGIDFFCNLPDKIEEHVETLPIENVKRAWKL